MGAFQTRGGGWEHSHIYRARAGISVRSGSDPWDGQRVWEDSRGSSKDSSVFREYLEMRGVLMVYQFQEPPQNAALRLCGVKYIAHPHTDH